MTTHRNGRPIDILLVEDNPGDVRLTREAFKEGQINNDLVVVRDGEAALDFLYQRDEYAEASRPDLILLDLNLPKIGGLEVLDAIKGDPSLRSIPVIILTGSESEEDIIRGYNAHSNAYLTKPVTPDGFIELVRTFEDFWLTLVHLPSNPDDE